ncbi:MAG: AFG1 family ATPase [Burkholderiales bacterium]|nr:AFG1 family ATPase [Burkholderiales bacterium]
MSSEAFPERLSAIARAHGFELDEAQRKAARAFARLDRELRAAQPEQRRLFARFRKPQRIRGIYLWGSVGRGKSFLMDAFFQTTPVARRQRAHFHRFMQHVHRELRLLQGQEDPMRTVAQRIADAAVLLCLDEFHVVDIGDAMLMRGLLEGLAHAGVTVVTTSNQHPDQLYLHGLQRGQFLPAIEHIKRDMEVVEMAGPDDYRLRALEQAGVYHVPLGEAAERAQRVAFEAVAGEAGTPDVMLEIDGRRIAAQRAAAGVAWFDFHQLCDGPRGTADYIELARRYHTILVSGVPRFEARMAEIIRRFTWMVDEFYDRRVKLIVSAAAAPSELYASVPTRPEIERTVSRLIEMQTNRYLSQPHLA